MSKEGSKNEHKSNNLKFDKDDNFFVPTTFKRNGNFVNMKNDTWQKVDFDLKNKNPSQILWISSSSFGSIVEAVNDDERLKASHTNWNYNEHGFVQRLFSTKKK